MIWTHKSITNTIINCTIGSKRITGENLNIGRCNFVDSMPQKKEELMTTKPFTTNYRKYYTKLTKMITSYSQDA